MFTTYTKFAVAVVAASLLAATHVATATPTYEVRTVGGGNGKAIVLVPKPARVMAAMPVVQENNTRCVMYASVAKKPTTKYQFQWVPSGGNARVPTLVPIDG